MILCRRRDLLDASARLRFLDDAERRQAYIELHLAAPDRFDAMHYWISSERFAELRAVVVGHARFHADGNLDTCGQLARKSKSTCGCVSRMKARDRAQHCPNGW